MTDKYAHIVEFELSAEAIVIHRLMPSGKRHLYTKIPIADIDARRRNIEGIGRILGEVLVLDTPGLRDIV